MKNRKTKLYSILLALGVLLTVSCSKDYLEEESSTSLPAGNAITSVRDLGSALNGVYSMLLGDDDPDVGRRFYYASDFTLYADLKGGDFKSIETSLNQFSPIGRYEHDKYSNFSEGYYKAMYVALARVNDILERVKTLEISEADKAAADNSIGQLHALRGLIHFDIARLYAQLPTVSSNMDASNSGIVIADKIEQIDVKPFRSTLNETYNFIISEFETSLPLLSKTKSNGSINYWAAKALKARVHLYLNDNNEALADAADVISNSPYALYTVSNYTTVWDKEGTDESMFEVLTSEQYNAQRNSIGYYTNPTGYPEVGATDEFVQFMNAIPTDVRNGLLAYLDDNGESGGIYPLKYPGRAGNLYVNNPKVIRLSEVYLIAAEAAAKGGSAAGALSAAAYINTLRSNRITGYTPVASVTLEDILNERRRELFAEGHMAWDFWRNGKTFTNVNPSIGVVSGNNPLAILPIPYREIQIAGEGVLIQNPGYN